MKWDMETFCQHSHKQCKVVDDCRIQMSNVLWMNQTFLSLTTAISRYLKLWCKDNYTSVSHEWIRPSNQEICTTPGKWKGADEKERKSLHHRTWANLQLLKQARWHLVESFFSWAWQHCPEKKAVKQLWAVKTGRRWFGKQLLQSEP